MRIRAFKTAGVLSGLLGVLLIAESASAHHTYTQRNQYSNNNSRSVSYNDYYRKQAEARKRYRNGGARFYQSRRAYSSSYNRNSNRRYSGSHPYQQSNERIHWNGHGVRGTPSIKIDISEQRAYFYKGDRIVGSTRVSTGKPGYETPLGTFKISEKKVAHRSNLYGQYVDPRGYVIRSNVDVRKHRRPAGTVFRGASMDYMMRVSGPVSMHAGRVPNYPASHGCIRLPWHMARIFFENASVGTVVRVVP
ncbi:L,D-transpeptidase family protein [Biformimicrobium ophioploci]|uniref:L,D-TPase catalytic domain-containing protein n=1 Tax=Biformimicrobium ophioploci TaxID=3036711 RepID=A0ABQ6LYH6_9GAMM|nr:L,D-transpeptidase family protein [Microbulbifer sp. NKW57]GMG87148.1 hypothetical protein MNKW57_14690 [Microbulbifer sp. NKW57]